MSTINERLRETLARLELDDDDAHQRCTMSTKKEEEEDATQTMTMFSGTKAVAAFERKSDEDDNDDDDVEKCDEMKATTTTTTAFVEEDDSRPSCAICLTSPSLENSCFTVPCLHSFCAKCIVRWANFQEEEENEKRKKRGLSPGQYYHNNHRGAGGFAAKCPSCRVPFENLLCYRELDGSTRGLRGELDLREHPWCLLKRSKWLGLEKEEEEEMYEGRRSSLEDSFEEEDSYHRL